MIKNSCTAAALACVLAACTDAEPPPGLQGVIELDERVLSFEVPGRVTQVAATRGALLRPDELVAVLDGSLAQTSVAIREAEARAADERAKLVAASGRVEDIRTVEAQLRAARSAEQLAQKRVEQDRTLLAKGAIAQAVYDDSAARAEAAVAERATLEQRLRELRSGARREEVAGARAQATAAGAAAKLEADRAARYRLVATHAGEVLDVHVEPGEVVGAGTPVVTVGDTTHPYVDVFVPQAKIAQIRVGAQAAVRVDSLARAFPGVVERVARRTEFTPRYLFSNAERANLVVRTRIRIDDPGRELHAGTPAFVTVAP